MKRVGVLSLLCLALAACEAETVDRAAGEIECSPLATNSVPVELADVLGAGRDSEGTIYVVDRSDDALRLFVASGDELVLRHEPGSGATTDEQGTLYSFSLDDGGNRSTVELLEATDGSVRMGVLRGELPSGMKQFPIGVLGEELESLALDELAALAVRREEVVMVAEYAGFVDDDWLVVVRPEQGSYEDFRAFFGPTERLQERTVTHVARSRDGGSTTVEFSLDGETALAAFPVVLVDEEFQRGVASLTIKGNDRVLGLEPEGTAPEPASYFCQ